MAVPSTEDWFVGEDGSLAMGEPTSLLAYHSSLNTLLVATKDSKLRVIDVTSGSILKSSDLSANKMAEGIQCLYLNGQDKLLFSNGYAVSVRNDLNGVMMLDTALQTPVAQTEDIVKVELPLPDASQLFKSLMSAELAGVDHVEDVLRELEMEIETAQQATKHNHKVAKWATVCLKLPYFTLKTVCSSLLVELKRLHQNVPGLSVASAVSDRLLYLLPSNQDNSYNSTDRSLMYSEAARRETFAKWPHMNYKWALPDPMAKAGFYHQPNSTGDDRAMCFTCNVCLVCWEPTDEPWSEHERHSSACPFVKGEYTQNVPLSVTHATEPAHPHGDNKTDKIACISTTSNCDLFATSTVHGSVVIWDCAGILKKHVQFHIEPSEPVVASCTSSAFTLSSTSIDFPEPSPKPHVSPPSVPQSNMNGTHVTENCIGLLNAIMSSSCSSQDSDSSQESVINSVVWTTQAGTQDIKELSNGPIQPNDINCTSDNEDGSNIGCDQDCSHNMTSAHNHVPELESPTDPGSPPATQNALNNHKGPSSTGTDPTDQGKNDEKWKKNFQLSIEGITEIPLTIVDSIPEVNTAERHRPSRDVIVSSLCVLGPYKAGTHLTASDLAKVQPSLVSGVVIRMEHMGNNSVTSLSSKGSWAGYSNERNEVQALNQVNQALSEISPEIISGGSNSSSSSSSSSSLPRSNNFVPYLLVHNIAKYKQETNKTKDNGNKTILSKNLKEPKSGGKDIGPKLWPLLEDVKQNSISEPPVGFGMKSASSASSMTCIPGSFLVGKDSQETLISSCSTNVSQDTVSSRSREGGVIQCIPLPAQVGNNHYVHSLTPTVDGKHLIVVTAPKCTNKKIQVFQGGDGSAQDGSSGVSSDPPPESPTDKEEFSVASQGGCILVYRVKQETGWVTLDDLPCRTCVIDNLCDAVISVSVLPTELGGGMDSLAYTDLDSVDQPSGSQGGSHKSKDNIQGCIALTTYSGQVKILDINSLVVLATVTPPDGDKIVSVTFCTGIDRLCCCGTEGKLYFYMIGPRRLHMEDLALGLEPSGWLSKPRGSTSTEDQPDCGVMDTTTKSDQLLVHQSLSADTLLDLHELTQFENLVPRFCATVPPCWNEIQQEQQQRRHPQHLQQQGDSTQHTRTWRLQQDSTSWDEHLFELVIPKSCCVGHIDIKFSLHPLCTNAPTVQVTLLRQSMTKLGRVLGTDPGGETRTGSDSTPASPHTKDVDSKIDFKIPQVASGAGTLNGPRHPSVTDEDKADQSEEPVPGCSSQPDSKTEPRSRNPVLTKEFLDRHGAEVLCGPVDMAQCVDLSGHGGIITLTGPELLKIKSRSFLLHFKAIPSPHDKPKKGAKSDVTKGSHKHDDKERASTSSIKTIKSKVSSKKHKDLAGLPYLSSQDRLTALTSKQKLDSIKGCDWFQELSITVRRCRPVTIPRERLQRVSMLEDHGLHETLLKLICGSDEDSDAETTLKAVPANSGSSSKFLSLEQKRILALDILSWICSIQTHATDKSREPAAVVLTTETYMKPLVRSCFLQANRTIAHQCSKFLTALIEYTKSLDSNPNLAPDFSYSLLSALLECLPSIPVARSAGALHWYFVMLNRVKGMDIGVTGSKCVEMLAMVTKQYNERSKPLHALLKSRFGLYGHPLEPELFDLDPPGLSKGTSQTTMTFANILKNNNNNNGGTAASTPGGSSDEVDIQDYLLLTSSDKGSGTGSKLPPEQISNHVFGLLEVEPLHFTCHAASDGTRLERLDTGPVAPVIGTTSGVAGLSGTINFGGENIAQGVPNTMSSLSAATEHQLSVLHQKHIQLLKLQQQKQKLEQKLAETSKGPLSGSTSVYSNPELFPPTPKNTPFFMTPPVTPPNESFHNIYVGGPAGNDPGKPPTGKDKTGDSKPNTLKSSFFWSQTQHLFQPMPPQALVIERLHSGARRFVVLDFGKPVLLTDVVIPGCGDLQSLSIDVWTQGEDVDGQRLVVAGDIGLRSLILNDLCPPPLCRFLKITTIGRHGGNASRSKIPLGSFYGHSFVFPWQSSVVSHPLAPPTTASPANEEPGPSSSSHSDEQNQVMSQLVLCMSLHEDIQCRYSLACNRLASLLSLVQVPHNSVDHTLYYLKQGKKTEDDKRVLQAYQDCVSLQLQLNLAQWAIDRLQGMAGMRSVVPITSNNTALLLKQSSTDKLRILSELLLDTLMSMTCPSPTVPQVPTSLYTFFTQPLCESLFRNLCLTGTKKIQIHTGVLLVRLCGNQPWWGEFLGNSLQEYFTSEQPLVFPRDRVFLVLCALSQKALAGPNAGNVLESLILLLGRLLSPLLTHDTRHHMRTVPGVVDQSLISWILLFLSRSLDNTSPPGDDPGDKGGAAGGAKDKDKDNNGATNRWDFLQGESSLQKKGGATRSRKAYHSRQRRGYWHPKYQLQMQQLNKDMFSQQATKALSNVYASPKPESYKLEALTKTHSMIKKHYKQYSSKHFKDILNIRRTTGEYLRKLAKEDASQSGTDADFCDGDSEVQLSLSRDKCIPVVRGLVSLILSTDFTCHVDLFIVACKVLARIASITRPAMMLSEVLSQSELDDLILLTCNAEYNHGNINWGGSWSGHTIACLLQDIIDGERMFGLNADGVTDDEVSASVVSETDDSLQNSTTLPTIDEDNTTATTDPDISQSMENNNNAAAAAADQSKISPDEIQDGSDLQMILMNMDDMGGSKLGQILNQNMAQSKAPSFVDILSSSSADFPSAFQPHLQSLLSESKGGLKFSSKKLSQQYGVKVSPMVPHGVSTAMDARLELGVQLPTELKLKVMLSLETESIQNALTAPLPPLPASVLQSVSVTQNPYSPTDDEQISEASMLGSLSQQPVVPSVEMLSTCFNALFCHRVNLDTLLLLWLTLNEDTTQEENGVAVFDPSRVPTIPLNDAAVSSLLESLCRAPHVPLRTWVLAFQCLTLLANLKYSPRRDTDDSAPGSTDRWLAHAMLADSNMMSVFLKFLTGAAIQGHGISSQQSMQVGPTAVKAFHEVLVRLQLRCSEENENMLRELLLRLVYQLSTERGAFGLGIGPLDAQCKLLDHLLEQSYQNVDINNAISVIESVSLLVHQHIMSQVHVDCRSSTESGVSAKSCFGGLFASVLRTGNSRSMTGDANRDILMCNLLSLVNSLVQAPVPQRAPRRSTIASVSGVVEQSEVREEAGAAAVAVDSPMTDFSKISQSLGGTTIMTSTPNFPMSDDEKGAETDEQKTEHAVPAPKPPAALQRERRSCNHFWDIENPEAERKEPMLADFVLGHQHIMFHFLQSLGSCNSNTIATILGSSGNINDSFLGLDPLSVGDGVFQILCTLNRKATDLSLILRPLYQYLSSRVPTGLSLSVCQLSEPLLWYILSVLDCEKAFRTFLDMGGVEVVCHNLVRSTHNVISTSPSLVSTIMQYLGGAKARNSAPKKITSDTEFGETLQNFAPLGTISSSSPSAGPADVLIQGIAPHRRARSAAWSFNFYPHEAWVDLTINLPCAILLREIHIQPHLASLATCPSAITIEVSRDSITHIPITSPLITSGLNTIKVTLQKPEVVTTVTIRLHKPRDSSTIGLSQIKVLGTTAFGDCTSPKASSVSTNGEDYVARTSMGWLRLLHHCLTHCEAVQELVAMAAAPVQPLLMTCTSLLLSSGANLYISNIEAVLLKLGLHSADMGLGLIDHLLRNVQAGSTEQGLGGLGRTTAVANESTVDLLYQLGINQDDATAVRVKAMTDWLGDSARVALQKAHGASEGYQGLPRHTMSAELPTPAPAHVHCVAAVLWECQERNVHHNLSAIVSHDLLSSMYEWSMVLYPDSALKKAVDAVVCSMCYIHPEYFTILLEWMGIILNVDLGRSFMTDDLKDGRQHQEALTDDLKATSEAHRALDPTLHTADSYHPILLQDFSRMMLDESHLSTLAIACQSPIALRQLLDSGFLAVLCQGLYEFCLREMSRWGEPVILSEMFTDAARHGSGPTSPRSTSRSKGGSNSASRRDSVELASQDKTVIISADMVATVLRFLAEISKEVEVKDWLGSVDGCVFWPVLLRLLCSAPVPVAQNESSQSSRCRTMTVQQRSAIETSTIDFFSCVLSCHHGNQLQFANILCDVIRGQGSTIDEYGCRSSPLCGFMRCLFLQVLLEDEKVWICLKASSQLYKGHSNALTALVQHPRFGAGHKYRVLQVSLQSSCSEVMTKVSVRGNKYSKANKKIKDCELEVKDPHIQDQKQKKSQKPGKTLTGTTSHSMHPGIPKIQNMDNKSGSVHPVDSEDSLSSAANFNEHGIQNYTPSLATQTAQLLEEKGDKTLGDDWLIDSNEMGIEVMVEQISAAAGLQAKEKRDKSSAKCPSPSYPPRPPSRRGHCPSEGIGAMNIPVLMLYHKLLPGQPLPGDLSLSQLLVMLKERGLPEGQASIDFTMKFKSKPLSSGAASKPDAQARRDPDPTELGADVEPIPDAVLLDMPSLPTALQVFAGVGGLALLAEHLPLLYPEVTRQGAAVDSDKLGMVPGNVVGQDWVTVENTEDIYEEIYEPIPPNQSTTGSKQSLPVLPSIPPHSLVAFGLFLRLPGYAEVLLKEKRKAQCLLRLVLGVTDDGEGGHILTSPIATSLPTLPFNVLKSLFDSTPISTDDGVLLRRMTLEIGVVHLVLACLSVLSHHAPRHSIPGIHQEIILAATQAASAIGTTPSPPSPPKPTTEDRSQLYWAKGTGFGTGSTASYWDAEQALIRQRCEEEHVTCLLQVLASFINPGGEIPDNFDKADYSEDTDGDPFPLPGSLPELLTQSCLAPAICSYLRNDSVLDMARHVPLYRSLLELLRGLAVCPILVPLLLPLEKEDSAASICSLLDKMKSCVDTYASRLKTNKKAKPQREDEESEGLALLIPDIQSTAGVVDSAIRRVREKSAEKEMEEDDVDSSLQGASKVDHSLEDRYMSTMRELQFDTFEIVLEDEGKLEFTVPHHYESNVKAAGEVNNASRARRLAQEAVTLSTSLPLSAGSSVFVRCDEERLDVMKVLITGPADTPYANGCFEFDVYFPQDYPNTPPQINLMTTGNHTVRFNPNLYNDGKVCLSILNTWHGRPEEKWNSQTSSFLQVLVSIQSLILVSEPYFNEPGYERSRGTASGSSCSKEYDANIRQASVKWAMLEMIRNPPACFKEVLECHFWMKRHEITRQIEAWVVDLEANCNDKRVGRTITHSCVALKRHLAQLKDELAKMKPPSNLGDMADHPESDTVEASSSETGVLAPATTKSQTFKPAESGQGTKCEEAPTQAIGNTASGQGLSPINLVEVIDMQGDADFGSFSSDSDSEDMDITSVGNQQQSDELIIGL